MKKALSILLSILLVFGTVAFSLTAAAEETPAYAVGDHIQFGTYPQTQVEETEELAAAAAAATWKSYGYYSGNNKYDGLMTPGDWMQFADFFCGDEKYRAVTFSSYRPNFTDEPCSGSSCYQYANGYRTNTTYYFKYEPLEWRVLDPATGYIMCEAVIDSQPYQNVIWHPESGSGTDYYQGVDSTVRANYYPSSSIRAWLNEDFYQTAFTGAQKAIIQTTGYSNEAETGYASYGASATNDKITMLSLNDIRNEAYGFVRGSDLYDLASDPAKMTYATDYAKSQGAFSLSTGNAEWMLRTPGGGAVYTNIVTTYTAAANYRYVNSTHTGSRPACCLSVLADNTATSSVLSSATIDWDCCGGEGDGSNVIWVYDVNGIMTISGHGMMADLPSPQQTYWRCKDLKKGVITEGVTTIPYYAFAGYTLTELTIPASVTFIGERALYHDERLERVNIPRDSQLTTIGDYAFDSVWLLQEIFIPGGVTSIGTDAIPKWTVIYGFAGTTAEAYANENGNVFVALCPTEHQNAYEVPATEATEAAHGYTAGVFCPDCETWLSGHEVIHNTLGARYPVEEAPGFDPDDLIAYSEEGDYIIYCSVCNEPGLYKLEAGTPTDPTDPNNNGGNFFTRFVDGVRAAMNGFISWFLRLIKWLK